MDREEHYQSTARNKALVLSTNKPIIKRLGLSVFPWTWKLIKGKLQHQRALDAIIEALENHIKGKLKQGG